MQYNYDVASITTCECVPDNSSFQKHLGVKSHVWPPGKFLGGAGSFDPLSSRFARPFNYTLHCVTLTMTFKLSTKSNRQTIWKKFAPILIFTFLSGFELEGDGQTTDGWTDGRTGKTRNATYLTNNVVRRIYISNWLNLATNVLLHFAIFWLSLITRLTNSSLGVSKPKQYTDNILQYVHYLF